MFKAIPRALTSPNILLRKEACITLANVMEKEFDDHDYVVDFDILYFLIEIAEKDQDEVKQILSKS